MGAPAPPFDRNPSAWRQRVPIALLALGATAISVYMGLYQWGLVGSAWDPVFGSGTETVLRSGESEIMGGIIGVPDAIFGAWAYLTEAVLSLAGSTRRWQFRPWLVLLFGLDVIPLGLVNVALVVVQGISVGAWCFLCLVTALISLVLVALAYDEVWASIRFLRGVWERERDPSLLWEVFIGRGSPRAYAIALEMDRWAGLPPRAPR
jgi:uncharacterized membrane protein